MGEVGTHAELGDSVGRIFDSCDVEITIFGPFGVGSYSSVGRRGLAGFPMGDGWRCCRWSTAIDDRFSRDRTRHGCSITCGTMLYDRHAGKFRSDIGSIGPTLKVNSSRNQIC